MIYHNTWGAVEMLRSAAGGGDRHKIARAIYRWARAGKLKNWGTSDPGGARWSQLELAAVAQAYVDANGYMPWQLDRRGIR